MFLVIIELQTINVKNNGHKTQEKQYKISKITNQEKRKNREIAKNREL